jgi:hypothetical protein
MTLNQVLIEIKNYFESHPLINDVLLSLDDSELNSINSLTYPIVDIQYVDTDVLEKRFQHNLKIIIADLTNPNVAGIDFEIFSDTIQIAGDFIQWLETNYDFDWIKTTNLQPFTDSNVDRTSGVVFNLGVYTWINKNIDC